MLTPNISKIPGRERNGGLYKDPEYAPDYAPNYEFGKKGLGSCGPKFEKVSNRKPMIISSVSLYDAFIDPEIPVKFKSPR